MALGWIAMRNDLHTHPKVVRISSALKSDILRTIGGLHSVWCLFDVHSTDGKLIGYTADVIDQMVRWPGFAQAMADHGWLHLGVDFVECPEFDKHNSKCAKKRMEDCERKRRGRMSAKCPQNVTQEIGQTEDKNRTTEQKRTEENIKATPLPPLQGEAADAAGVEEEGTDISDPSFSTSSMAFVVSEWNLVGATKSRKISQRVRGMLRARMKDPWWMTHWQDALEQLPKCKGIWGDNDRGWKCNLEWFVRPDTVQNIIEGGKYGNTSSQPPARIGSVNAHGIVQKSSYTPAPPMSESETKGVPY